MTNALSVFYFTAYDYHRAMVDYEHFTANPQDALTFTRLIRAAQVQHSMAEHEGEKLLTLLDRIDSEATA